MRFIRDELRVTTLEREFPLPRIADWIYYAGKFYSDAEIVPSDQMGSGRNRRRQPFDPRFTEIEAAGDNLPAEHSTPASNTKGGILH